MKFKTVFFKVKMVAQVTYKKVLINLLIALLSAIYLVREL